MSLDLAINAMLELSSLPSSHPESMSIRKIEGPAGQRVYRMNIPLMLRNTIGTAMLAGALLVAPQAAQARVFISVGIAPPLIPYYAQPLCPGDGYIWTPGYWAYGDDGYEWVDGAWVLAPYEGALWTPGYWGWGGGAYFWNAGYWGRRVGYYGGINYGYGYFGTGFYGGYWGGGHFFYNRGYNNIGGNFHNVYNSPYRGGTVHPGGASFARVSANTNSFRGSNLNGSNFAHSSSSFTQGGNRSNFAGSNGQSFNRGQGYQGGATSASHAYSAGGGGYRAGGGESSFHGGGGGSSSHGGGGRR
jgi:hypothetical protein